MQDDDIKVDYVDYVEGPPLSPKEMGIEESAVGGGGESLKPSDLKSELREIFNPSFSTLGHGTRVEAAQEILPICIEESAVGGGGESLKPSDLKSELREIFNPSFSTLGHGTRVEAAQEILQQGLRAKQPDLYSTTVPLFDGSKPYEEQITQVVEQ